MTLHNRSPFRRYWVAVCLTVALATLGCAPGAPNEAPADGRASAQEQAAAAEQRPEAIEHKTWKADPKTKLPFPNREEMFAPPSQTALARAPRQASSPDLSLRGFATFGKPRAVLEIEGAVMVLGEGEERHGVRVVAIDPPRVTLQRNGQRWTESMFRESPGITSTEDEPSQPQPRPPSDGGKGQPALTGPIR